MLGQRGVKQGLCFLLFYGQLLGKDPQLLLLPLQLGGQLNLLQSLLVQQDEIPGGVMGGEVRRMHLVLLQLLQAAELGGAQVYHALHRLHPDHLAFPSWREM